MAIEKNTSKERFNPYDRNSIQRRVANETPSQIVKLLKQQPPTESKFVEPSQSTQSTSDSTEYVRHPAYSPIKLLHTNSRFNTFKHVEPRKQILDVPMFKRKHRHNELADDRLSEISEMTNSRYSHFDRVFKTPSELRIRPSETTSLTPPLLFQKSASFALPRLASSSQQLEPFESPQYTSDEEINREAVELEQTAPIFEHNKILQSDQQQPHAQEPDRDIQMKEDLLHYQNVNNDNNADNDGGGDGPIQNTQKSLFHDITLATPVNTQKYLFHEITVATQPKPEETLEAQTTEQEHHPLPLESLLASHSQSSAPASPELAFPTTNSVHNEQLDSFEENVLQAQEGMQDDNDFYDGGDDYSDEGIGFNQFVNETASSPNRTDSLMLDVDNDIDKPSGDSPTVKRTVKPREKIVVQGDSFISKKMKMPLRTGYDVIGNKKVKSLFESYLSFDKRITVNGKHYSGITDLFFEQMVDDLKNYKANQPSYLQNVISREDVLLLMKRQKVVTEKQSIEALAYKYLPKEYSDLICESALAFNQLYPPADDVNNQPSSKVYYSGDNLDDDDDNDDDDDDDFVLK